MGALLVALSAPFVLTITMIKTSIDFEEVKRWPLAELCIRKLGYKVNKKHDSWRWRCLKTPGGTTILVPSAPNDNGYYTWHSPDKNLSGTILDLLLKIEGMAWPAVREFLLSVKHKSKPKTRNPAPYFDEQKQAKMVLVRVKSIPKKPCKNNYLSLRNISFETIRTFGVSPQEDYWEVPLYSLSAGKMRVQTTIRYCFVNGQRKRFFLKGVQKKGALAMLSPDNFQTTQSVYIFESPVDALSFYELFRHPGIYLATCGTVGGDTLTNINHILSHSHKKLTKKPNLYLCFDNDLPGQKNSQKIEESCKENCQEVQKILPKNKDFTEDLVIKNK